MRKLWAIVLGGAAAGFLDHMSALATFLPQGANPMRLHQYLASGVLGEAAFAGGWATAVLGLCVHFTLTTLMAGIFVATSQKFPVLLRHPWPAGLTYGMLIYFVMNYVAVPLSAAPNWKPGQGWAMVGGLLGHALYVGVPIAAIAHALLADRPTAAPAVTDQQQLRALRERGSHP